MATNQDHMDMLMVHITTRLRLSYMTMLMERITMQVGVIMQTMHLQQRVTYATGITSSDRKLKKNIRTMKAR